MSDSPLRHGLLAVVRERRLAATLWLINLALASLAAAPAWAWWNRTANLPEGDSLLQRLDVGVFSELLRDGGARGLGILVLAGAGVLVAGIVVSALANGGVLEILLGTVARSFTDRFCRGAGRYFWRFLRLGIVSGTVMAVLVVIATLGAGVALQRLSESAREPGLVTFALVLMVPAFVATYFLLALDYARINIALTDRRRVLAVWLVSLWFVLRHPLRTYGLTLPFAVITLLMAGAYLMVNAHVVANTWLLILLIFVAQQIFILVRSGLRVGLVAGELALYRRMHPTTSDIVPAADERVVAPADATGDPSAPQ